MVADHIRLRAVDVARRLATGGQCYDWGCFWCEDSIECFIEWTKSVVVVGARVAMPHFVNPSRCEAALLSQLEPMRFGLRPLRCFANSSYITVLTDIPPAELNVGSIRALYVEMARVLVLSISS